MERFVRATRLFAVGLLFVGLAVGLCAVGSGQGPLRRWIQNRRDVETKTTTASQCVTLPDGTQICDPAPTLAPALPVLNVVESARPLTVTNPQTLQQTTRRVTAELSPSDLELTAEEQADGFRRQLVQAARAAAKAGTISRRDAIGIRVASFSPAFREAAETLAITQMVFSGENPELIPLHDDGTVKREVIDWEGLTAFLEAIIPLVIQLLKAFGL